MSSVSSPAAPAITLWGSLDPCSSLVSGIEFNTTKELYQIGRRKRCDYILSGPKISNTHCIISWNRKTGAESEVKLRDYSSNGTFINGRRIGGLGNPTKYAILRDGTEIAFGCFVHCPGEIDHRYIFRHLSYLQHEVHNNYEFTKELGRGAFGTVTKALNKIDGCWYAVKTVHLASFVDSHSRDTFVMSDKEKTDITSRVNAEVDTMLKAGQHENVCTFKEAFFEEEYVYLVLEYIPGGSLSEYLKKKEGGRLDEDETRDIVCQICRGLAHIHSESITHRDLKLDNILLTTHKPPTVKIADFGLAKTVDEATMLKTVCGTPAFVAPEIIVSKGSQTSKGYSKVVDSWSVGVICFYLFTGKLPYTTLKPTDSASRKKLKQLDTKTLRDLGMTEDGVEFIWSLLCYNPLRRSDVEDALEHIWLQEREKSSVPLMPFGLLSSGSTSNFVLPAELTSGISSKLVINA